MGVRRLMESPPDLVLSGVNSGQNAGDDVTYSGTVAGAMEGTMLGIRSFALSQAYTFADGERDVPWQTAERHAPAIIDTFASRPMPAKTLINVNFPNCQPEAVRGVRVTAQGAYTHGLYMEERRDGRGLPYYWLRFGREVPEQRAGSDIVALRDGYISVTPLKLDLTDEAFAREISALF
jgi:5'-nucleotidase